MRALRQMRWLLLVGLAGCVVVDEVPADAPQADAAAVDAGVADATPPDSASPPLDGAPPDAEPKPDAEPEPDVEPEPEPAPWLAREPEEHRARPLDVLCLDGRDLLPDAARSQGPWRYHWRTTQRPQGSVARWVERYFNPGSPAGGGEADDPDTPQACLFLDLAGEWRLALDVGHGAGTRQRAAELRVLVVPDHDIHVQLVWDTPADGDQTDDDGTDVDLHLRHPLGQRYSWAPLDCYFANSAPEWGPAGPGADPSLDIDDVNGAGPENINLEQPEDTLALGGAYRIGVQYYRSESFLVGDYGESLVTVRVFLRGSLAAELQRPLSTTDNFWEVADIHWEDGVGRVEPVDVFHADINQIP